MLDASIRERFVETAVKHLGYPSQLYRNPKTGKDPRNGFDCSGFIVFLLELVGFPNPQELRHTNELFDHFGVSVHIELRQRGDLVFFSRNGLLPTHVGILASPSTYIHAPGKKETSVELATLIFSDIEERSGRLYLSNPIGIKRLSIANGRYQKIL